MADRVEVRLRSALQHGQSEVPFSVSASIGAVSRRGKGVAPRRGGAGASKPGCGKSSSFFFYIFFCFSSLFFCVCVFSGERGERMSCKTSRQALLLLHISVVALSFVTSASFLSLVALFFVTATSFISSCTFCCCFKFPAPPDSGRLVYFGSAAPGEKKVR